MKLFRQAELLSMLVVSSLACGQESMRPTSKSDTPPLEVKLKKAPRWNGSCLELTVQLTNVSKSPVFLGRMYQGIKIYSSVSDPTNTMGQGAGEAWMLVYGWTDVVPDPIELASRNRRQNTLCVADTFPMKETGKETLRRVRVQGKIRIVAGYEIPAWKSLDQSLEKGKRAYVRVIDKLGHWTFGEVALEVPVPCHGAANPSSCLSPPEIYSGEHDVHAIEPEPPPDIETKPPQPIIFPIDRPTPATP